MALVKSSVTGSKFSFTITMAGPSINTNPLIVGDVPWRVCFVRSMASDSIKIFLACDLDDKTDAWWIEAEGHLNILSSKIDEKPIERKLKPNRFTNTNRMSRLYLIKDFMSHENGYVLNNTFAVQFTIISKPLVREPLLVLHAVQRTSQQFLMRVENVDKLIIATSPTYNLRGVNWFIEIQKREENLSICLFKEKAEQHFALTMEATVKIKLLSYDKDAKLTDRKFKHSFPPEKEGWGWIEFMTWDTFIDERMKYVENNTAFFDIDIEVGPWKPMCG